MQSSSLRASVFGMSNAMSVLSVRVSRSLLSRLTSVSGADVWKSNSLKKCGWNDAFRRT